jgi:hypothetical protein
VQVGATLTIPYVSGTGSFTGILVSQVWANDLNNPFLGGNANALTFTYLLENSASSPIPTIA